MQQLSMHSGTTHTPSCTDPVSGQPQLSMHKQVCACVSQQLHERHDACTDKSIWLYSGQTCFRTKGRRGNKHVDSTAGGSTPAWPGTSLPPSSCPPRHPSLSQRSSAAGSCSAACHSPPPT
eukprot:1161635-Pelagomonas_calceolata.AAC.10